MYPAFIKTLLESQGDAYRSVGVFSGDFTFVDISIRTTINAYFAYLFGGLLRRIACMLRPYEIVAGTVDKAVSDSVEELIRAFRGDEKKLLAVKNTVSRLEGVAVLPEEERPYRPKAAIFGDIYIRDNEVINQNIIKTIESAGGEVVTTPYSDYVKIIAGAYFKKLWKRKHYRELVIYRNMLRAISLLEGIYYRHFSRFNVSPAPHRNPYLREEIESFGLRIEHTGESFENTLKIFHILKAHPDISLFVQVSPAFCCPSMVTEAMAPRIESVTGVPVVSVIYDGTGAPVNDAVVPYIAAAKERERKEWVETRR
jgi:predicted nucleotide-binding protein (sugar kinase/HSP70/actin superfamily)